MKNKIEDLRNHLFETLEALKDPDKPMELDRAMAVANVAKVIVESAKVEVDFVKATGSLAATDFIPLADGPRPARVIGSGGTPVTPIASGAVPTMLRTCESCQQKTKVDPCDRCGQSWRRAG